MRWLYTIGITCYSVLLRIASIWHRKARSIVRGRSSTLSRVTRWRQSYHGPVIWIHCASHGEYEQVLPVITGLRDVGYPVALSFYSPSGYEHVDHTTADLVFYLPADTPRAMQELVDALSPTVYIMAKYDYWYNLLLTLQDRTIPQVVIAATYRRNTYLLKWYGRWFAAILQKIDRIYVQSPDDATILQPRGFDNIVIGGDTRVNRSHDLPTETYSHQALAEIKQAKQRIIVYGSIWQDDIPIVNAMITHYPSAYHLIAPHEVDDLSSIKSAMPDAVLWSSGVISKITIIDAVGILKYLYRYGDLAYVGGGMHGALHNTLEPAAYHLPLLIAGDARSGYFKEVAAFIDAGVCIPVNTGTQAVEATARLLARPTADLSRDYQKFFKTHKADLQGIIQYISHHAQTEL